MAGKNWQGRRFVFASTIGAFVDDRNLHRDFQTVLAAAELPHMRMHDPRHTCASVLPAQGVSPKVVQEILGRSEIGITLDLRSPHSRSQGAGNRVHGCDSWEGRVDQRESEPDGSSETGCQLAVKLPVETAQA